MLTVSRAWWRRSHPRGAKPQDAHDDGEQCAVAQCVGDRTQGQVSNLDDSQAQCRHEQNQASPARSLSRNEPHQDNQ